MAIANMPQEALSRTPLVVKAIIINSIHNMITAHIKVLIGRLTSSYSSLYILSFIYIVNECVSKGYASCFNTVSDA